MTSILNDLAFALRQLRKSPGFAITAVLTLALGIGANAALFTVIDSVLIRPLPYYAADRLILFGPPGEAAGSYGSTSWRNLEDIRQRSRVLEEAAGYEGDVAIIQTAQGGETVFGPKLTWNLLNMIGAKPAIGRGFTQADGEMGAPPTAILSDQLWRAQFKADPNIVGQMVRVGSVPHTVVGVMPPEFHFPDTEMYTTTEAVWLPFQPTKEMMTERGYNFLTLIGRLRRGVTLDQARADLDTTAKSIAKDDPKEAKDLHLTAIPFQNAVTHSARPVFLGLFAALALVLLIACANVANLQLARCLARQQEFAVRTALGADRWRLIRQLLVEGGLLAVLGSAVGLGLSTAILWSLHKLPRRHDAARLRDSSALFGSSHAGGRGHRGHASVLAAARVAGMESPAGNSTARPVTRFDAARRAFAYGGMARLRRGRHRSDSARRHRPALSHPLQSPTPTARLLDRACNHLHRDAARLRGLSRLPKLDWELRRRCSGDFYRQYHLSAAA